MKLDIVERWCDGCEAMTDHEIKTSILTITCQTCGLEHRTTFAEINEIYATLDDRDNTLEF